MKLTWYTFTFYKQTDSVAIGGPAFSSTAEIYIQAHKQTVISRELHPPKVWERPFDDLYSMLIRRHLENLLHHIINLHQNIKFTIEEKSNEELMFLGTLVKQNNGKNTYIGIGNLRILTRPTLVSYLFNKVCSLYHQERWFNQKKCLNKASVKRVWISRKHHEQNLSENYSHPRLASITAGSFHTKWCKIFEAWIWPISEFDKNLPSFLNI